MDFIRLIPSVIDEPIRLMVSISSLTFAIFGTSKGVSILTIVDDFLNSEIKDWDTFFIDYVFDTPDKNFVIQKTICAFIAYGVAIEHPNAQLFIDEFMKRKYIIDKIAIQRGSKAGFLLKKITTDTCTCVDFDTLLKYRSLLHDVKTVLE
jgi:hypothetical protein